MVAAFYARGRCSRNAGGRGGVRERRVWAALSPSPVLTGGTLTGTLEALENVPSREQVKKGDVQVRLRGHEQQLSAKQPKRRAGSGRTPEARRTGVRLAGLSGGPGGHWACFKSAAARPQ